jgi:hypothetical protein
MASVNKCKDLSSYETWLLKNIFSDVKKLLAFIHRTFLNFYLSKNYNNVWRSNAKWKKILILAQV